VGNGPRLNIDIETDDKIRALDEDGNVLTEQDIEDLTKQAQAAFGQPSQVLMSAPQYSKLLQFFNQSFISEINPEYRGTPWATMSRLTKREHAVAKVHTFLSKLGVLRYLSEEDMKDVVNRSVKRLKRARWSRYGYHGKKKDV
jgi:hypothetical protein